MGTGRIANPTLYDELYLAATPTCAIAETFGRRDMWSDTMLDHRHGRYAIATHELDSAKICELDDAQMLLGLGLRPSRVVTPQRDATQEWSARIYRIGGLDGISWWSFYNSDWTSYGIWNTANLRHMSTRALTVSDPDFVEAADAITRRIV